MAKFSNAKVGDRVWSSEHNWGTITEINKEDRIAPIRVLFDRLGCTNMTITEIYNLKGFKNITDTFPTLFWNEFHIPTDEEDKKTFNLVEFLRENLVHQKFIHGIDNYYLNYDHKFKVWFYDTKKKFELIGVYFKKIDNDVIQQLNINRVTPEQLKQAYKELGWL